jgi:hypothetical protein
MKPIHRLSFLLASAALAAAPALGGIDPGPPVYTLAISSPQFSPFSSDIPSDYIAGTLRRFSTSPLGVFLYEAHPPNGAVLQSVTLHACDTHPGANVLVVVESFDMTGGSPVFVGGGPTLGMPGCVSQDFDLPAPALEPYVVDDTRAHLVVRVHTMSGDESTSFSGVTLNYTRPVDSGGVGRDEGD